MFAAQRNHTYIHFLHSLPLTNSPIHSPAHQLTHPLSHQVTEDDKDYIEERMRKRGIGNMVFVGELYHKGLIGLNIINALSQLTLRDMEDVEKVCGCG